MAIPVRLRGQLDIPALHRSLDHLLRRHEILRTTFTEHDGRLIQIVHPAEPLDLPVIDLTHESDPQAAAAHLLERNAQTPLDLEQGPLLRLLLARIGGEEHQLLRINHHIVSDGPSWRIFFDELRVLYDAYTRGESPALGDEPRVQYGDFSVWEREHVEPGSPRHRAEIAWWRTQLEGIRPVALPFARPSFPLAAAPVGGVLRWEWDPDISDPLDRVGREAGVTDYMVRLALISAQVAIETGRRDVVLMGATNHRRRAELQGMFGPLYNLVVLRLRFDWGYTLRQWLECVRVVVVEATAHAALPLDHMLRAIYPDGDGPHVQAFFSGTNEVPPTRLANLEVTNLRDPRPLPTPEGVTFFVTNARQADSGYMTFNSVTHDPGAGRAYIFRLRALAAGAGARPDHPLRELARAARQRGGPRSSNGVRRRPALVRPQFRKLWYLGDRLSRGRTRIVPRRSRRPSR